MIAGYPKTMKHPAYEKGIPQQVPPKNHKPQPGESWFPGTSDRFPDVIVTNPDQQAWHESRGYVATDGSRVTVMPDAHDFQEYPKFIKTPEGEEVLVNSVEEESEAMMHNQPGKLGSPARKASEPAIAAPKRRGRKPGSKNKPKTDRMAVHD